MEKSPCNADTRGGQQVGLLEQSLMLFFFYQKSLTAINRSENKEHRCIIAASLSGISGLLVNGLFDYSFYNFRIYFVFFVVIGIVCASDRIYTANNGGIYE